MMNEYIYAKSCNKSVMNVKKHVKVDVCTDI